MHHQTDFYVPWKPMTTESSSPTINWEIVKKIKFYSKPRNQNISSESQWPKAWEPSNIILDLPSLISRPLEPPMSSELAQNHWRMSQLSRNTTSKTNCWKHITSPSLFALPIPPIQSNSSMSYPKSKKKSRNKWSIAPGKLSPIASTLQEINLSSKPRACTTMNPSRNDHIKID